MPPDKGLKYAEDQLGVNAVHALAEALAHDLEETRQVLALKRRIKHSSEEAYRDAEIEYLTDERPVHSDLSQTAWEKLARDLIHINPDLRKLRASLADEAYEIEKIEVAIRRMQDDLAVAVARMNELGGYFVYLAEIKRSRTVMLNGTPAVWPGVSST